MKTRITNIGYTLFFVGGLLAMFGIAFGKCNPLPNGCQNYTVIIAFIIAIFGSIFMLLGELLEIKSTKTEKEEKQ